MNVQLPIGLQQSKRELFQDMMDVMSKSYSWFIRTVEIYCQNLCAMVSESWI